MNPRSNWKIVRVEAGACDGDKIIDGTIWLKSELESIPTLAVFDPELGNFRFEEIIGSTIQGELWAMGPIETSKNKSSSFQLNSLGGVSELNGVVQKVCKNRAIVDVGFPVSIPHVNGLIKPNSWIRVEGGLRFFRVGTKIA